MQTIPATPNTFRDEARQRLDENTRRYSEAVRVAREAEEAREERLRKRWLYRVWAEIRDSISAL